MIALKSTCPHCRAVVRVKEENISNRVRCPQCKQPFEVKSVELGTTKSLADSKIASETITSESSQTGSSISNLQAVEGLGRFQLREVLGQGAFGRVYRAFDPRLDREVALKVPIFGPSDTKRVRRFLTEAKAAARLRHPNIVPVYESGEVDGRYFIAAQFVAGQTLAARIEAGQISFREAAEWVRALADALAYAHGEGIVHRDIKPENIMLDAKNQPQIMDFGLAKRTSDDSSMTVDGSVLGTPAYMSPEQARGDQAKVGPLSDQYSLGAVLYELLTGKRPFDGPSHSVIASVLKSEPAAPRAIRPEVPLDLQSICQKAMCKEQSGRYDSIAQFGGELRKWLADLPISARPAGPAERFRRWVFREPLVAGLVLAIVSALFMGAAVSTGFAFLASANASRLARVVQDVKKSQKLVEIRNAELQRALANLQKSEEQSRRALFATKMANARNALAEFNYDAAAADLADCPEDLRDAAWQEFYEHANNRRQFVFAWPQSVLKERAALAANLPDQPKTPVDRVNGSRILHSTLDPWKFLLDWPYRIEIVDVRNKSIAATYDHPRAGEDNRHVIFVDSFAATKLFILYSDRLVTCDLESDSFTEEKIQTPDSFTLAELPFHLVVSPVHLLLFDAQLTRVFQFDRNSRSAMELDRGDESLPALRGLVGDGKPGQRTVLAYDGLHPWQLGVPRLLIADTAGVTVRHRLLYPDRLGGRGRELGEHKAVTVPQARLPLLLSKARVIADVPSSGQIEIWQPGAGAPTASFPTIPYSQPWALSSNGKWLAMNRDVHSLRQVVTIYDLESGKRLKQFKSRADDFEFGTGSQFAMVDSKQLTVWYMEDLPLDRQLPEAEKKTAAPAGKPSAQSLAAGSKVFSDHTDIVWATMFAHDGLKLASGGGGRYSNGFWNAGSDFTMRIWDLVTGDIIQRIEGHEGDIYCLAWSRDDRLLLSTSADKTARLWNTSDGSEYRAFRGHEGTVSAAVFTPDESQVITAGSDKTVRIWDVATAEQVGKIDWRPGRVWDVALSPDGKFLAICGDSETIRIVHFPKGDLAGELVGHTNSVVRVAFSPDGAQLASGGWDNTARVWNVKDFQEVHTLKYHSHRVEGVAWSPDGRHLATTCLDNVVRVYDTVKGELISLCEGHEQAVARIHISPQGEWIASAGWDGDVRLWPTNGFAPVKP